MKEEKQAKVDAVAVQVQPKAGRVGKGVERKDEASQWTVEQRLGALEGEVKEMHDTLKEIKKAIVDSRR